MTRTRRQLAHCVAAMFALAGSAAFAQSNGGFEAPALANGVFNYGPSGASWSFTGGAGIAAPNSGFTTGAPEIPQARQVGFIQNSGTMQQTVFLAPGAVLSFMATQRNGYPDDQELQVLVNGVVQNFKLGAPSGRVTVDRVKPARGWYETYAVRLASVTTSGNYTVTIKGLRTTGDGTALIDSVAVSTPASRAYGFWDQGLASGAWRSDLPTSTPGFATGPCIATQGSVGIIGAGGTPVSNWNGNVVDATKVLDCYGGPGGPSYPTYTQSNWTSYGYTAGSGAAHWIGTLNNEIVAKPGCGSGPPNQSLPNVPAGSPGASLLLTSVTAASDPAIGNKNVVNILYNYDAAQPNVCIPYLAFGASTAHGNEKPIAIATVADAAHRPNIQFKEFVTATDGSSYAVAWITFWVSGWSDNLRRLVQVQLGKQAGVPQKFSNYQIWNWNVVDSYYYPGGRAHHNNVNQLNASCGLGLPAVSFTNTYVGSGHSPSSITSYDIDLYDLLNCIASNGAWNGVPSQLPDPLVISGVEWAVENVQAPPAYHGDWPPAHNALGIYDMRIQ